MIQEPQEIQGSSAGPKGDTGRPTGDTRGTEDQRVIQDGLTGATRGTRTQKGDTGGPTGDTRGTRTKRVIQEPQEIQGGTRTKRVIQEPQEPTRRTGGTRTKG